MSGKYKNKVTDQPDNDTTNEIENQLKDLREVIQ